MLLLKESEKLNLHENSKYYGWCRKVVMDNAHVTVFNSSDFKIGHIPPNVIFDIFMGYASGCLEASNDIGSGISHQSDKRADYTTTAFYQMMVDIDKVFKTAHNNLKKLRNKYKV